MNRAMTSKAQTDQIGRIVVCSIFVQVMKIDRHFIVVFVADDACSVIAFPRFYPSLAKPSTNIGNAASRFTLTRMRSASFGLVSMAFPSLTCGQSMDSAVLTRRRNDRAVAFSAHALSHTCFAFVAGTFGQFLQACLTVSSSVIYWIHALKTLASMSSQYSINSVNVNADQFGCSGHVLSCFVGLQNRLFIYGRSVRHVMNLPHACYHMDVHLSTSDRKVIG